MLFTQPKTLSVDNLLSPIDSSLSLCYLIFRNLKENKMNGFVIAAAAAVAHFVLTIAFDIIDAIKKNKNR